MRIFFDHLQKTGGSTLNELFARALGRENVTQVNITDRFSAALQRFAGLEAIAGHVDYFPGDELPADRLCMTLLRDPVERCLSWYSYNRHDVVPYPGPRGEVVTMCRSMSLLECIGSTHPVLRDALHDHQTSHFARMRWDGTVPIEPAAELALAKEVLDGFALVGIQEELADFVDLVCARLGWPAAEPGIRLKASSQRMRREDLDGETLAALVDANRLDRELHADARERFGDARRREFRRLLGRAGAAPGATVPASAAPVPRRSAPLEFGNRKVRIVGAESLGHVSRGIDIISGELASLTLILEADEAIDDLTVGIHIHDAAGGLAYGDNTRLHRYVLGVRPGNRFRVRFMFRADLGEGEYRIGGSAHRGTSHLEECFHWNDDLVRFNVAGVFGSYFEGRVHLYPQLFFGTEKGEPITEARVEAAPYVPAHVFTSPPLQDFRARVTLLDDIATMPLGAIVSLQLEVENRGAEHWRATGENSVRVSYHWLGNDGEVLVLDGERSDLPYDLPAGGLVRTVATIKSPKSRGDYRLAVTLVQDGVAWFDEKDCEPILRDVVVE